MPKMMTISPFDSPGGSASARQESALEGCSIPVLVVAFNRPDTTAQVLRALGDVRPRRVYFAVDGPRSDRPEEARLVAEVQGLASSMPWADQVLTRFRSANLGCKHAVSDAISWFFEHEEQGIILEDDCVAHPTFFRFAEELLDRYKDDSRVMGISGNNFQRGDQRLSSSYYFSRHFHIWGWATWRRAWAFFDYEMKGWPEAQRTNALSNLLRSKASVRYWTNVFSETSENRNSSWGYRWLFAVWMQGGLCVTPNRNLVTNVGFGADATHTTIASENLSYVPSVEMPFPLKHPAFFLPNCELDRRTEVSVFGIENPLPRFIRRSRGFALHRLRGLIRPYRGKRGF